MSGARGPSAPNATVGEVTHYSIALKWDPIEPLLDKDKRCSYMVEAKMTDSLAGYRTVYRGFTSHTTITDLKPDQDYECRVRALDPSGVPSNWGKELDVTTAKLPLSCDDLMYAVSHNCVDQVREAVAAGVDPNGRDKYGHTPLMIAAQRDLIEVIDALVDGGASLRAGSGDGKTCLMVAAFTGKITALKRLMELGADIMQQDKNGCYAIHHACGGGRRAVVKALLQAEPQLLEVRDSSSWTPLMYCAMVRGSVQCASVLIEFGADVNTMEETSRRSVLMMAVISGFTEIVQLLVRSGARPDDLDKHGVTPRSAAEGLSSSPSIRRALSESDSSGTGSRAATSKRPPRHSVR